MTMKWVFDLHEKDMYWCTADIGWVTGHSYVVYGPLSAGATTLMYEGAPDFPQFDRWWQHRREVPGLHFLHVADGDPRADPAGRPVAELERPVEPAAAGFGRRADQSGGMGVVSPRHRQGPLPDRRYVVADGNGRDHDRADAGRGAAEAGIGHAAAAGCHCRHRRFLRAIRSGTIAKAS